MTEWNPDDTGERRVQWLQSILGSELERWEMDCRADELKRWRDTVKDAHAATVGMSKTMASSDPQQVCLAHEIEVYEGQIDQINHRLGDLMGMREGLF